MTYDTIRQGRVSSINYEEGRVRIVYDDRNDAVTSELPLQAFEYDMPFVGDMVYVAHQSNGVENAVVLSRYFSDENMPEEFGWHIWRKEMRDGNFLKYDRITKTLTINIENSPDISINIIAGKDVNITTNGSVNVKAEEKVTVEANQDVTVKTQQSAIIEAKEDIVVKAQSNMKMEVKGTTEINSTGKISMQSDEKITIRAPRIYIN